MSDLHFGECPYCDGYIERPFWDVCCFDCQDEITHARCPRCEGYEATYHTFEGQCSEAANSLRKGWRLAY